jgi:hypothetical protein
MYVIGIDPGLTGAIACLHSDDTLTIEDMPVWSMMINKHTKMRVDPVGLRNMFEMHKACGCSLVLMEQVGGRPKQGASGGFVLGYSVGLVYQTCVMLRIPIETVVPQVWKRIMNVKGKKVATETGTFKDTRAADHAIIARADEVFPNYSNFFRGSKGGLKVDRAEAALLAKYCRDYALMNAGKNKLTDTEYLLAYDMRKSA